MGVLIPVGAGQATFVLQCQGSPKSSVWTLGFKDAGFSTAAETAQAIYNAFTEADATYLPANMSDKWTFLGVKVTYQAELDLFSGEFMDSSVGTASIAPIPMNGAILVRKNTALGGRKQRGRCYLPPASPVEANVDAAGFIGSGDLGGIQTLFDASIDNMVTAGITPWLLHSEAMAATAITSFTVQNRIATQRRRMR